MSPAGSRLSGLVQAALRGVRRDAWGAVVSVLAMVVLATLLVAWLLGTLEAWAAPSAAPLLAVLAAAAAAAGAGVWGVRRWVRSADERRVAAAAEARFGLDAGSLQGLLELGRGLPEGVSAGLYRRAESRLAQRLEGMRPDELGGDLGDGLRLRRRRATAGAVGLLGAALLLGFLSPERSRAGWVPLLHPVEHLSPPPLPPLRVLPGDTAVTRGDGLEVAIQAPGRSSVVLHWKMEGDVARRRTLGMADDAVATRLSRIDAPLQYWVDAPDGASSDTFRVTPLDALLVADLTVDVRYPGYLHRTPERFRGEVPPLEIPAGTELVIRGRTTRPLSAAALARDDGRTRVDLVTEGETFTGRWTPVAGGSYAWELADAEGGRSPAPPPSLALVVVADAAPQVQITAPARDMVFGPDLRLAVSADARDDHGVRSAALVSWTIRASGERSAPVVQAIPLGAEADRFLLDALLDGDGRGLLPGDTLRYLVRVVDNSPAAQVGVSRSYAVRIPGMAEMRELADDEAGAMLQDASTLTKNASQLEQSTKDLARRAAGGAGRRSASSASPGGQPGGRASQGQMDFQDAEKARQILERQEDMVRQVEAMRDRTEMLQRAMEAAGLNDPQLQQRMRELRELYDQILTPELKQKLEDLRRALGELDPEQVQRALEQLAEQQADFRERLEQSMELLKRAAAEQQMNALAQEARELAAQQKALAEAMREEGTVSRQRAEQQRRLSERADSLKSELESLRKQLAEQGESQAAEQTREAAGKVEQAQGGMRDAADMAEAAAGESSEAQPGEEEPKAGEPQPQSPPTPPQFGMPKPQIHIGTDKKKGQNMPSPGKPQPQQGAAGEKSQEGGKDAAGQQGQQAQPQQGQPGQQQGQQSGQQGQKGQSGGKQGAGSEGQQGQRSGGGQRGQKPGQGGAQAAQAGEQAAAQLDAAARQLDAARQSMAQGWKQEVQETVQQATGDALSLAERQSALLQQMQQAQRQGGQPSPEQLSQMRAEQGALKQGLEAMGRNLSEAGQRSALLNRDVGSALGRSMLSMQQTLDALAGKDGQGRMPVEEAQQTVDALNRLALELLQNGEQIEQAQSGTGMQEALQQMAELGKQQGALNGQSGSLLSMGLSPQSLAQQLQQLAAQQAEIAKRLGGMNDALGGQESLLGRLDALSKEADALARELEGGRLTPELRARQERLFHRLLDAGRTLERDDVSEQRTAERPGEVPPSRARALDPALLESGPRFRPPTPEQLRALPAAYRKLILEYFDRLNRSEAEVGERGAGGGRN